mmetsp:Transcript_42052/g.127544  ORF Transcript_42052/g.127544 Transcript_42052/m.127544 type:complete len:225 (-) Transcript_42052:1734-2408(-)
MIPNAGADHRAQALPNRRDHRNQVVVRISGLELRASHDGFELLPVLFSDAKESRRRPRMTVTWHCMSASLAKSFPLRRGCHGMKHQQELGNFVVAFPSPAVFVPRGTEQFRLADQTLHRKDRSLEVDVGPVNYVHGRFHRRKVVRAEPNEPLAPVLAIFLLLWRRTLVRFHQRHFGHDGRGHEGRQRSDPVEQCRRLERCIRADDRAGIQVPGLLHDHIVHQDG